MDAVLNHVRYRFDAAWSSYYRAGMLTAPEQAAVLRGALGTTACDTPMILALFLLMAAKDGVQKRISGLARLNRARQRAGRAPLLEHVDACLHLQPIVDSVERERGNIVRRPARLHHVRGHLTRRGNKIFWRTSHLRGSARQGSIRTRTVSLTFH